MYIENSPRMGLCRGGLLDSPPPMACDCPVPPRCNTLLRMGDQVWRCTKFKCSLCDNNQICTHSWFGDPAPNVARYVIRRETASTMF